MILKSLKTSPFFFGGLGTTLALGLSLAAQAQTPLAKDAITLSGNASYLQHIALSPEAMLMQGIPKQVNLLRAAVPKGSQPASPPAPPSAPLSASSPSLRFALPATFAGLLPCADCRGIAHTLTLQSDGSYRLRRIDLGKSVEPSAEAGRWTADQSGKRIALQSSPGNASHLLFFSIRADGALRQLDGNGHAIKTSSNMDLRPTAQLDLVNEAAAAQMGAAANAQADAKSTIEPATAALQNTYWKLVELGGQPMVMLPDQEREVRITLTRQNQRLIGFSGCNALGGRYARNGALLRFDPLASSMRLCEPALNTLERRVLDTLVATTAQHVNDQQLSLLAGDRVLVRFEAVYLK